jgi:hypothetical protein
VIEMTDRPFDPRSSGPGNAPMSQTTRIASLLLALVVVELGVVTGYIHLTLGTTLFTVNGLGYLVLATVYAVVAWAPRDTFGRLGWLSRLAVAAYALLTIGAYLVAGSYFLLGWATKGIEVAIVALVIADLLLTYGDPRPRIAAAVATRAIHRGARRGAA